LRMAIFAGFFIGYAIYCARQKRCPRLNQMPILVLLPLSCAILIGFIMGATSQTPLVAFQDGNAYLFLLYAIPILSHDWQASEQRTVLQILCAGAIWNILLTFGLLYLYTHFSEMSLKGWYTFLRDVRLAEVTRINESLYRIFIQTQFFAIALGAFFAAILFRLSTRKDAIITSVCLGGVIATLVVSFSRSFWVGILAAFFVLLGLLVWMHGRSKQWGRLLGWGACSFVFGLLLIAFTFFLPPQRGTLNFSDALSQRTTDVSDAAVSSRWNLLAPMQASIASSPFIGSGFGKTVTFITDDPRARSVHPDGKWTTYTMEWGWLELWLKMGILGPVGFLFLFVFFASQFLRYKKTDRSWIGIGCLTGLTFLYVTHFFSPYLNHPIGLGFILLLFIFLPDKPTPVTLPIKPLAKQRLVTTEEVLG
ncbi:MAG: O-antigen ligase family protein, partial [Patescibacteria group bacterium]